jgi:UDP-2,3-diacylglucosamine pyrophosphatase LpxH
MIAVISDLHFEEEASDIIRGENGHPQLVFRRNLDPAVYYSFIDQMAEEVARRKVREFELVIAGDLFDFNRTVLWFKDDLRPYVATDKVSAALEQKIANILEAIVAEPVIKAALGALRLLAQGHYRPISGSRELREPREFPAERIAIHYLVGNHDRLSNATPGIRRRIRELLGLQGDAPFAQTRIIDDPAVLIRHGHEYDGNNFALDFAKASTIPLEVPEEGYSEANFGDVTTIDIAVRLPHLFRQKYGDRAILKNRVLSSVYLRLLQFDDVRPQSALLDYLLDSSGGEFSADEVWEKLVPVLQVLLEEIEDNPFFRHWLWRRAKPWAPAELDAARRLLKLGAWRNRVAREVSRKISHFMLGGETDRPELMAQREEVVQNDSIRLVLSGHTHAPQVSLIKTDREADRFYINTGTWRNSIPSTPDGRTFGLTKALTYVMLFSGKEDPKGPGRQFGSFDYWTGYTRHWSDQNGEGTKTFHDD